MNNNQVATKLSQSLPIPLTLLATNGAGRFTIPKGTRCKIERRSPTRLIVWVPLEDYKRVHPYGFSSSFFFGRKNPTGVIINDRKTDWEKGSPNWGRTIPNPAYFTLEAYLTESN
jgi:hypothetical protein